MSLYSADSPVGNSPTGTVYNQETDTETDPQCVFNHNIM